MKDFSKAALHKRLVEAGIRPTFQRVAILEYVLKCRCHPTADEIYSFLEKENPTLSRTTVFSAVKLLAGKGLINDIDISAESTRYDSICCAPHAHFICRRCNRIYDIPLDMSALTVPEEFSSDNVNVFFKGLCPECKGKPDNENQVPTKNKKENERS